MVRKRTRKEAPGLDLTVEEEGNQDFTLEDESEDHNQNSVHHKFRPSFTPEGVPKAKA
jgi:hypothetical protein